MTCRTYSVRAAVLHGIYIAFLSVCGFLTVNSAVFGFSHIGCTVDIIAACFTCFISLLILSVDFFECRAMSARLYIDENGLGVKRFGKTKVFIRWENVKEIGEGKIQTPFGYKKRVYFSDKMLDESEKCDLVTMKYHTVHFSNIPQDFYRTICEKLPPDLSDRARSYVR